MEYSKLQNAHEYFGDEKEEEVGDVVYKDDVGRRCKKSVKSSGAKGIAFTRKKTGLQAGVDEFWYATKWRKARTLAAESAREAAGERKGGRGSLSHISKEK